MSERLTDFLDDVFWLFVALWGFRFVFKITAHYAVVWGIPADEEGFPPELLRRWSVKLHEESKKRKSLILRYLAIEAMKESKREEK